MKKIFLFAALALLSVTGRTEVSITVTPDNVDFGTVNMYEYQNEGVEDSVDIHITWSGLQPYCGVYYDEVESPNENCGFWLTDDPNNDGYLYGGDTYTSADGPDFKIHYYATDPGIYTAKWRFYSYEDADWEVESESVYLTIKLVVINQEPVAEQYELASSIAEGDIVVFANTSAQKVANAHSNTFLSVVDATIEDNILKSTEAMEFTVGKNGSYWTFTHAGQMLGGDNKSLRMGSGETRWTINFSSGEAEIIPAGSTYPIMFNSDRFKLYDPATTTFPLTQLYKKKSNIHTDINQVESEGTEAQKILRGGQLFILRDGETYTITGARVQQ